MVNYRKFLIEMAGAIMEKIMKRAAFVFASFTCLQVLIFSNVNPALSAASVTAQENLEQLIKTRSCRGCDLAGLTLNTMDLSGVDLEGADLSFAKFYLTNLAGANLKNTKLNGAVFGGADLGEADLRGADLEGASLDSAYLGETLFDVEEITINPVEEVVVPVVVVGQTPQDTSVTATTIEEPESLNDAPSEASISKPPPTKKGTLVNEGEIIGESPEKESVAAEIAEEEDLSENEVEKAPLGKSSEKSKDENLNSPEIAEADPQLKPTLDVEDPALYENSPVDGNTSAAGGAPDEDLAVDIAKKDNLTRLLDKNKCFGCDLSGLDLSGKNLKGADLERADLSGCNLENVKLDRANLKGALLQHVNLRNASLKGADLYRADLTGADLTNAVVKGAMFDGAKTSETVGFSDSSVLIDQ
ncbi:MAG: hypothetical protein GQ542_03935 [Desulforhopalus sp.]|nr:hypothetical protein [Desulforhopalus sp.]